MAEILDTIDLQKATLPPGTNGAVPVSLFADEPLTVGPEQYPNGTWSEAHANYNQWWSYYKGWVLNERAPDGQLLYPAGLNHVRPACINHASVFLGQYADDKIIHFGISTQLGTDKELAIKTKRALNLNWVANQADNLMLAQSIFMQVLGGYIFKLDWRPNETWPIRYETVDPRAVFPVWDGTDYERLVSIDIMHEMPLPTAQARFRAKVPEVVRDRYEFITVHEHWDETEYWIKTDEGFLRWANDNAEMRGPNPWKDPLTGKPFIPFIYVPRLRTDSFYGESLVPSLTRPQAEQNNLVGHLIDAVAEIAHMQPWVAGRPSGAKGLHRRVNEWLNLGMGQFGQKPPEVGRLPGPEIQESVVRFIMDKMPQLSRELGLMPDIAWGRNEASVRSALTLAMLFWPATSVAMRYRTHAGTGFRWLNYKMICMALQKGVSFYDITPEEKMLEAIFIGHQTKWPPMLPQDRTDLMNEITNRMSTKTISPETAIERLDGPDAVEDEITRIDEYRKKLLDAEVELAERTAKFEQPDQPFGGKAKTRSQGSQAQAKGGRTSTGSDD